MSMACGRPQGKGVSLI